MPIPACEITGAEFEAEGKGAPYVLPCGHVYSLTGLMKVVRTSTGQTFNCPRCQASVPVKSISKLQQHERLCKLVRLLRTYRIDPAKLVFSEDDMGLACPGLGMRVYQGVHVDKRKRRQVLTKVVAMDDAGRASASRAWRELVLKLQLSEVLPDHVVRVFGYAERAGRGGPELVVALQDNVEPVQHLMDSGMLKPSNAMRMARQLLQTLQALQDAWIIHGGLCPACIFYTSNEPNTRYKLDGFQTARMTAPPNFSIPVNELDEIMPFARAYAPPERWQRDGVLTHKSDVWAFAATAHHALVGRLPYVLQGGRVVPVASPGGERGVPAPVLALLARCMVLNPAERPTAREVSEKLQGILEDLHSKTVAAGVVPARSLTSSGSKESETKTTRSNTGGPPRLDSREGSAGSSAGRSSAPQSPKAGGWKPLLSASQTMHSVRSALMSALSLSKRRRDSSEPLPRQPHHAPRGAISTQGDTGRAASSRATQPAPSSSSIGAPSTDEPSRPRGDSQSPTASTSSPSMQYFDPSVLSRTESGRQRHPLSIAEQGRAVMRRLGIPNVAIDTAMERSASLEDNLQWMLRPGSSDEIVKACQRRIRREYERLVRHAHDRGDSSYGLQAGAPATVTTADVWLWVSNQVTQRFTDDDIDTILKNASVDDDVDVSLEQFTSVVVHMFQLFFEYLDANRDGYLTLDDVANAFADPESSEATTSLRKAFKDIDRNSDGNASLNEFILYGLGSTDTLSHRPSNPALASQSAFDSVGGDLSSALSDMSVSVESRGGASSALDTGDRSRYGWRPNHDNLEKVQEEASAEVPGPVSEALESSAHLLTQKSFEPPPAEPNHHNAWAEEVGGRAPAAAAADAPAAAAVPVPKRPPLAPGSDAARASGEAPAVASEFAVGSPGTSSLSFQQWAGARREGSARTPMRDSSSEYGDLDSRRGYSQDSAPIDLRSQGLRDDNAM